MATANKYAVPESYSRAPVIECPICLGARLVGNRPIECPVCMGSGKVHDLTAGVFMKQPAMKETEPRMDTNFTNKKI